jgi:hypothetical protein
MKIIGVLEPHKQRPYKNLAAQAPIKNIGMNPAPTP